MTAVLVIALIIILLLAVVINWSRVVRVILTNEEPSVQCFTPCMSVSRWSEQRYVFNAQRLAVKISRVDYLVRVVYTGCANSRLLP